MVGSSLNGLGTNNSDIDLCLVIDSIGEKMCHMRFAIPVLKWAERILSRLRKFLSSILQPLEQREKKVRCLQIMKVYLIKSIGF